VGDGAAYIRTASYRNVAGVVTLIGGLASTFTAEDVVGFNATFTISGTNILVRVTGAVGSTLNWHSCTNVEVIS
jgi:hypothetical protein